MRIELNPFRSHPDSTVVTGCEYGLNFIRISSSATPERQLPNSKCSAIVGNWLSGQLEV